MIHFFRKMGMEQASKISKDRIRGIKKQSEKLKGKEYRYLWVSVNFAVVKDLHIQKIGLKAFGIFFVIRVFMNKEGIAYPSLGWIAHCSDCSMGTVRKEIEKLIECGWLKKEGRVKREDGKFGNTQYRILEKDLIRGTGQEGFMSKPLSNLGNGD